MPDNNNDNDSLQLGCKMPASEMEALRETLRPAMGTAVDPDVMEYVLVMVGNQHTIAHIEQEMEELDLTASVWASMKIAIVDYLRAEQSKQQQQQQQQHQDTETSKTTTHSNSHVKRLDAKDDSVPSVMAGALSAGRDTSGSRQKRAFERLTKQTEDTGPRSTKQQRGRGPPQKNRREEDFMRAPSGDRRRAEGRGGRDGGRNNNNNQGRDGPPRRDRDVRGGGRGGGRDQGGRGDRERRGDFGGRGGGRDRGGRQVPRGGGRIRDDQRRDDRRQTADRFEGGRHPGRDGGGRGGRDFGRGHGGDGRNVEGGRSFEGGRDNRYEESWDEDQQYQKRPRYNEEWVPRGGRRGRGGFRGHPSPLVAARGRGRGRHYPDYNEVKTKMASMQWVSTPAKKEGDGGDEKTG